MKNVGMMQGIGRKDWIERTDTTYRMVRKDMTENAHGQRGHDARAQCGQNREKNVH